MSGSQRMAPLADTDTLALVDLITNVTAQFVADGLVIEQAFGWREPARQTRGLPAIVWTPGDPSGDLGKMGAPRFPGRVPNRPLATLRELFTCQIGAHDATDPENELKQYDATHKLFDAWWRAIYLSAHGTVEMMSARWIVAKNERRRGATIRAVCAIQAMIPDSAISSVGIVPVPGIFSGILESTDDGNFETPGPPDPDPSP